MEDDIIKKTVDDIRTEVSNEILTRLPNIDLTSGTPERDMFVEAPIAGELSTLWDQVVYDAKLHAPLTYYNDLTTDDIQSYLANYNIVPFSATYSTGTVTFYSNTAPSRDVTIPEGTIVTTDSSTPIQFAVTVDYVMYASLSSYYYNALTNRYEIQCNVRAVSAGPSYRAGSSTVTIISSSISGLDGVTNLNAISGGLAAETIESALRRVIDKFQGRNLGTTQGLKSYVQRYSSTVNVVGANDTEMVRDQGHGGSIDFYIIGENQDNGTDNINVTSTGLSNPLTVNYTQDSIYMVNQPIVQMLSVIKNGTVLSPDNYTFVADTRILKNSSQASDYITLTSTGLIPLHEVTIESASNISNAEASFGSYLGHGFTLRKASIVALTAGTDFQWDKRLDASATQDPIDGFGTVTGGIIDTKITGALSTGKYIRIVEDTKNVVNATGLALKVYAKDLTTYVSPPKDRMYIDPVLGRFVLPQPSYWSKCESVTNLSTGDIGSAIFTSTGSTILTTTTGKFDSAIKIETPHTSTPLPINTLNVGTNPEGVCYGGNYIWVANFGSNNVSIIDPLLLTSVGLVTVGSEPSGICYGNNYVWVANANADTVSVINPSTQLVVATIAVGNNPIGICYGNGYVWVTNLLAHTVSVINSNTRLVVATINVGTAPTAVCYDSNYIWVANFISNNVTIIDPVLLTTTGTVAADTHPSGICSGNGYIWVSNYDSHNISVINATSKTFVQNIDVDLLPIGITYNEAYLWVAHYNTPGTISKIDVNTYDVVDTITVGTMATSITYNSDTVSKDLWVTNRGSNTVSNVPNQIVIQTSNFTLSNFGLTGNGSFTTSFWVAATYSGTLADPDEIWESSVKVYFNSDSYALLRFVNNSSTFDATMDIYNNGSFLSSTNILAIVTELPTVNFHHCYFTITNSNIALYIDGSNSYTEGGTFSIVSSYIKLNFATSTNVSLVSASQLFIDNIKVWNEIPSVSALWEYNNLLSNGLHIIYGATNDYRPILTIPAGVGFSYFDPTETLNYFKTGDILQVNYIYNSLYKTIEDDLNSTVNHYMNRDYLVRGMMPITIDVYCRFKQNAGQDFDTVANTVQLSIASFIDGILNNGNVERADIAGVMKSNASVDNIDLSYHTPILSTDFYLVNTGGGTLTAQGDVIIGRNEYPIAGTITLTQWI